MAVVRMWVRKDDADWVKQCMSVKQGTWQNGHPKKTWRDCVRGVMEKFGLSHLDSQDRSNEDRESRGNRLTRTYLAIKVACVCLLTISLWQL